MAGSDRNINFYIRDSSGEVVSSALRIDTVTYGLPMLAALILGTKSNSLVAKARALLLGLLAMSVITIPAVMLWGKMTSLQLEEQIAIATTGVRGGRSSFFFYAFHGYAFSQPVIAVGIWLAIMMLGQMNRSKKETGAAVESAASSPSRNAPCPCGSGLKYKRCCGAA